MIIYNNTNNNKFNYNEINSIYFSTEKRSEIMSKIKEDRFKYPPNKLLRSESEDSSFKNKNAKNKKPELDTIENEAGIIERSSSNDFELYCSDSESEIEDSEQTEIEEVHNSNEKKIDAENDDTDELSDSEEEKNIENKKRKLSSKAFVSFSFILCQ